MSAEKFTDQRLLSTMLGALLLFLTTSPAAADPADSGPLSLVEKMVMPGQLTGKHAKYEQKCESCHAYFKKTTQDRLCLDCHKPVRQDLENGSGFHGRSPEVRNTECKHCHTDHKGREADIVRLDPEFFDHRLTDFILKKNHVEVRCDACHDPAVRHRDTKTKCIDCHRKDDPHAGRLGENCTDCHQESWKTNSYEHGRNKVHLKGKHQKVACSGCHPGQRWKNTPLECAGCHRVNDVHGNRFGAKCDKCHTPEDWKQPTFEHGKTKFPLQGKHETVQCEQCHRQKISGEERQEKNCFACHRNDDQHKGLYGSQCERCHTPQGWRQLTFDHGRTKFPLKGKHQKTGCIQCHRKLTGENSLSTECHACHRFDDAHRGQQGNRCDRCHNPGGWSKEVFFDHDLTRFPLVGLHAMVPCEDCHVSNVYRGTGKDCSSCHRSKDPHKRALGIDCAACHNPNGWKLWQFEHSKTTFDLTGAHAALSCRACHRHPVKEGEKLPGDCFSCHFDDDAHQGGFGRLCERCHDVKSSFRETKLMETFSGRWP